MSPVAGQSTQIIVAILTWALTFYGLPTVEGESFLMRHRLFLSAIFWTVYYTLIVELIKYVNHKVAMKKYDGYAGWSWLSSYCHGLFGL